jgi:hypothetical protein
VSSRGSVADGQAAAAGRSAQPVQGWGAFELQRRCCAVYAGLLHSRQDALLLYSMGALATAGEGRQPFKGAVLPVGVSLLNGTFHTTICNIRPRCNTCPKGSCRWAKGVSNIA